VPGYEEEIQKEIDKIGIKKMNIFAPWIIKKII
jgi:hypothetical protein